MRALFLRDGKWYGNEFPEEPKERPIMSALAAHEVAKKRAEYDAVVEKLKAEAMEVVNPELFLEPYKGVDIINEPGVLYPWDGGWEIVELRGDLKEEGKYWCNECCNGDRCDDPTHLDRRKCPYCKGRGVRSFNRVLRLLPKAAVTKGASDDYSIVDALRRGGEADTPSDETPYLDKLEALVNTAVVAAIGVPERHDDRPEWLKVAEALDEQKKDTPHEFPYPRGSKDWMDVVTAFIIRVGNYMLKHPDSEHYALWGKQLKQHAEEIRSWYAEIPSAPVNDAGGGKEAESREIWDEVLNYCQEHYINDVRVLEYLMKHYHLTRNP
jgi:hypothetical protein